MKKDHVYKTWDNFKYFLTEVYLGMKDDNELKNKYVVFMVENDTYNLM